MTNKRILILLAVLAVVAASAGVGWYAGSHIESPAEAAARTAPPKPSPILVPVERLTLSSNVITRGTARFGLPQPLSVVPSGLKGAAGLIATLPRRNVQLDEGDLVLSASGRPLFLLSGEAPAYRDLAPGVHGNDVRQLEQALERLGIDPGPIDGIYDRRTSAGVQLWYEQAGWDPFGPTPEQLSRVRALEHDYNDALKRKFSTESTLAAAGPNVEAARAAAESAVQAAEAELAARRAELQRVIGEQQASSSLLVDTAEAQANYALQAAEADVAAKIQQRAQIVLDPRQPKTAQAAAEANLELARAALERTRLEGETAVRQARRDSQRHQGGVQSAQAAVQSAQASLAAARLEKQRAVRAAEDAKALAELDAKMAEERADLLANDLAQARARLGIQVPADEVVFLPSLPVRVEEITAAIAAPAAGTVMTVTDNRVSVDGSLPLDAAPLVKPGMRVQIDEQALGIKTSGTVTRVADTPGTNGVDGFHIYFEVAVDDTPQRLEGFSLRLTIPIESTEGDVIAVPLSAVSLGPDGRSRVQRETAGGSLSFVTVEPGMSADGYVAIVPLDEDLEPGDLVVIGYDNP